jgi:hypothetical protein
VTEQVTTPGPVVRVVCQCGRKLASGATLAQAGLSWTCDRPECARVWQPEFTALLGAWIAARAGDQTIRLPLA